MMTWHYRHTVLGLCTLAFFVTMAARLVISPLIPALTADFGVSNTVIGVALTGMWMTYSLSQFPSGIVADRFGERPVILVSIGGTSLLVSMLALAQGFELFATSVILLGAFAGFHYSVATTLLTRTYENIGTATGLHNGGAPVAGVVVPLVAVWVESRFGWRSAFGLVGAVGVSVFVLVLWRVRPTPPRQPDRRMRKRLQPGFITRLLSRPSIAFTVLLAVAGTFVWQGISSFLPTFLVAYRGQSVRLAGIFYSLYFVVQAAVQIVAGTLSDRVGRDGVVAGCMAAGSLGVVALIVLPGLVAVGAAVTLIGCGMSYAAAVIPRFVDNLAEGERGTGLGLVRTVYGIFAALGSVVVGFLADTFGWPVAFGTLIGLMVLVLFALAANRAFSLHY